MLFHVSPIALVLLRLELTKWRRLGAAPLLWWRDDDARSPDPALTRLFRTAGGLPIALAVVPDGDLPALAEALKDFDGIVIGQHGVDHYNRSGREGISSEYPDHVTSELIAEEIAKARSCMDRAGLTPRFYAPPWNALDERTLKALASVGFPVVSAGSQETAPGLSFIGAQIDIMRWKGGARFRGSYRILRALRLQLRSRRRSGQFRKPIGLLTHHLAHDEAAWRFLDWFLSFSRGRFLWRSLDEAAMETGRLEARVARGAHRRGMAEDGRCEKRIQAEPPRRIAAR